MSDWDIGGVVLPGDLEWTDRATWHPQKQAEALSLAGGVILQRSVQVAGRPLTLETSQPGVFVTYADVQALENLLAQQDGPLIVIEPGGTEHTCRWRHSDGAPIDAAPLLFRSPVAPGDIYNLTLRLMII